MSLICWSGGLDSTLVLYRMAKELRDGTVYHPHGVRALTIVHPQVSCHFASAAACRKSLVDFFSKHGLVISYLTVEVKQNAQSWKHENLLAGGGNPQALLWLTTAVNYLEENESLYTGYIRGDDYWHHADQFRAAFDSLQRLGGKTGGMWHPLEWESKADVIKATKDAGLYRHCWWCEETAPKVVRGKAVPCGKCKSCHTHETAEWQLSRA